MAAICGLELSRRADHAALLATVLAVVVSVVVPALYVVLLPMACAVAAAAAPTGRRAITAVAVWVPVSAAVLVGSIPIA